MGHWFQNRTQPFLFLCTLVLLTPSAGFGIVLHPDGEPNLTVWTNRPDSNVVGRWGTNASCVVIAPNYIITTRHQCGGTETSVTIGGTPYSIEQIWVPPNHPSGKSVDLRVARLHDADLESYVSLYTEPNETIEPDDPNYIVFGGYGSGRGAPYQTSGVTYAYGWGAAGTLQWCTNRIDDTTDALAYGTTCGLSWIADVISADFDGPNSIIDDPNSTIYEGAVAGQDSGGGWFIKSGNTWKVAGLSCAVEHNGESRFRNKDDPNGPDPDELVAVRISSYAEWISGIISVPADLTGDYWVNSTDFTVLARHWWRADCNEDNNWCQGTDFEPTDGWVDWYDLAFLVDRWLCDQQCY